MLTLPAVNVSKKNTCIIICGPTASGKTNAAIQVAQHFNTQIISADSRQCYKELNVAVAKPTNLQLATVPHYFINTLSITQPFTAADYEKYALATIQSLFTNNKVVVMCGGTGLYIKAFCQGLDDIQQVPEKIRQEIKKQYNTQGLKYLQACIKIEDELYGLQGETQNPQRLMRALEVVRATGKSIINLQLHSKKQRDFNIIKIALDVPRDTLYNQINTRVDSMISQGLEAEAKLLYPQKNLNALQTVGYNEMFQYFDNMITLPQAIHLIKQNTRHYAKRQVTWFKKEEAIQWLSVAQIIPFLKNIL